MALPRRSLLASHQHQLLLRRVATVCANRARELDSPAAAFNELLAALDDGGAGDVGLAALTTRFAAYAPLCNRSAASTMFDGVPLALLASIDRSGRGALTTAEIKAAGLALCGVEPREAAPILFDAFDAQGDGNGALNREEFGCAFTAVLALGMVLKPNASNAQQQHSCPAEIGRAQADAMFKSLRRERTRTTLTKEQFCVWFQRTLSDDAPTTTTRKSSIDDETRAAAAQQITPRASRSFPSPRVSSPRAPRTMAERRRLDAKDRTSLDQQQWRRRSERRKRKRRSAGVEVHRRHRRRLQQLIVREWRRIVHTSHADTARARHREGVQRVASLQHCVRAGVRRVASLQHRVGAHSAAARGVTAAMAASAHASKMAASSASGALAANVWSHQRQARSMKAAAALHRCCARSIEVAHTAASDAARGAAGASASVAAAAFIARVDAHLARSTVLARAVVCAVAAASSAAQHACVAEAAVAAMQSVTIADAAIAFTARLDASLSSRTAVLHNSVLVAQSAARASIAAVSAATAATVAASEGIAAAAAANALSSTLEAAGVIDEAGLIAERIARRNARSEEVATPRRSGVATPQHVSHVPAFTRGDGSAQRDRERLRQRFLSYPSSLGRGTGTAAVAAIPVPAQQQRVVRERVLRKGDLKRRTTNTFSALTFCTTGLTLAMKGRVKKMVREGGGTYSNVLEGSTHLVFDRAHSDRNGLKCTAAAQPFSGIVIVTPDWVHRCLSNQRLEAAPAPGSFANSENEAEMMRRAPEAPRERYAIEVVHTGALGIELVSALWHKRVVVHVKHVEAGSNLELRGVRSGDWLEMIAGVQIDLNHSGEMNESDVAVLLRGISELRCRSKIGLKPLPSHLPSMKHFDLEKVPLLNHHLLEWIGIMLAEKKRPLTLVFSHAFRRRPMASDRGERRLDTARTRYIEAEI